MIKIVSTVLQVAGVSAGAVLGLWLKHASDAGPASPDDANHGNAQESHDGGKADHGDDKKKAKKEKPHGGHDGGGDDDSKSAFLKFSRQFIVPIVNVNGVNSLVVLDINLEVAPAISQSAYTREPKLRDALLRTLLNLSNSGAFNDQFIRQENLDAVREKLLGAAKTILHDDVTDVLILSISRQDI